MTASGIVRPRAVTLPALMIAALGAAGPGATADRRPVEIGTARAVAGQTVRGSLTVAEEPDGSPVALPIAIVTGTRPGPVVWVQASAHGDEYGGPRALQDVVRGLDPATMSGAVVAVMITNPPAFRALQRVNPSLDDLADMGDAFPGRERFTTERIAAAVTAHVRRVADYFVDLHTGGDRFRQCPFVFYSLAGGVDEARYDELARAFGVPLLWRDTDKIFAHDAVTNLSAAGIPAFLLEVGGGQPLDPADLRLQADAVRNLLRAAGVLPGGPAHLASYAVVTGYRIVTNGRGGFFDAAVKPCDRLREDSVLATITDVYGDVAETLKAPAGADIVLGVSTYPAAPTGGWVLELGTGYHEVAGAPPVVKPAPQPTPPLPAPTPARTRLPVPEPPPARAGVASSDAVALPAASRALDPTGRYAVVAAAPAAGAAAGSHELELQDLSTGQTARLLSIPRTASVLWAPDGSAFAVTDRTDADSSTLRVFFPASPADPVDVGTELTLAFGAMPEREKNRRVLLEAVRWLDPRTLRFRLRGHGAHDPEGFDELFDYVVGERVRRASSLLPR